MLEMWPYPATSQQLLLATSLGQKISIDKSTNLEQPPKSKKTQFCLIQQSAPSLLYVQDREKKHYECHFNDDFQRPLLNNAYRHVKSVIIPIKSVMQKILAFCNYMGAFSWIGTGPPEPTGFVSPWINDITSNQ